MESKGPLSWEQMNREELDYHYSPSKWSHRMGKDEVIEAHINVLTTESELAKQTIECELGVSYGMTEKQKIDIFGARTLPGDAPIFVYIHGGYWQLLCREMSSFMVLPLCKAGAVVITVGYDLAPDVGMDEIVSQVKKAVGYCLNLAKRRGSSGVYLCGHSAGGHLAAMMLSVDWMSELMISGSLIKGAVLVSGVYNLRPLVRSYVNDPIKMNDETAWRNSPCNNFGNIIEYSKDRKVIVAIGQHDPPTFRSQNEEFSKALQQNGVSTLYLDVNDMDHFNVIENLRSEDYVLTKECIKMMNLNIDDIVTGLSNTAVQTSGS